MITDYYIRVHRCRVGVSATCDPHGWYQYHPGVVILPTNASLTLLMLHFYFLQNWRTAPAMITAVPPLLPGLISSINATSHTGGAPYPPNTARPPGFFVASGAYSTAPLLFPTRDMFMMGDDFVNLREERADSDDIARCD